MIFNLRREIEPEQVNYSIQTGLERVLLQRALKNMNTNECPENSQLKEL